IPLVLVAALAFTQAARAVDEELITGTGTILVDINKGRMVRLDQAISSVAIADPNVADVQVVSPRLLFLRGKMVGETTVYAVDHADNTVFSAVVEVTHNLRKLEEAVKRASPDSDIVFHSVDGGLVMEGFAPTSSESEQIRNL